MKVLNCGQEKIDTVKTLPHSMHAGYITDVYQQTYEVTHLLVHCMV
jgi:predicted protein tyrosine phosphatase